MGSFGVVVVDVWWICLVCGGAFWPFLVVLGQLVAQVGPRTPLIGSGSKNGAERTQNQPRGPIRMRFRDHFLVRAHN